MDIPRVAERRRPVPLLRDRTTGLAEPAGGIRRRRGSRFIRGIAVPVLAGLLSALALAEVAAEPTDSAAPVDAAAARAVFAAVDPERAAEQGASQERRRPCESAARCTWHKTLGGGEPDKAYAVAAAADGGLFVAGHSRSFGGMHFNGVVIRLDRQGEVVWQRVLGGHLADHLYGVVATPEGGALVAGTSRSRSRGKGDAWVVRLDREGDVTWERRYGGREDDRARAVAATDDGGFVVAGFTRSEGAGGDDAWILRLDGDGGTRWTRTLGGPANDAAFDVAVDAAGAITVAGFSQPVDGEGYDARVWRLSADGILAWERRIDHGLFDAATAVTPTGDGGVLLLGVASAAGLAHEDTWALRLNADGEVLWRHAFEGPRRDTGWSALSVPDGFLIALATNSRGAGSADAWIVRLDTQGRRQWERFYGGRMWDRPADLALLSDGAIALGGYTTSPGAGYEQIWLLRLDDEGRL